MDEGKRESKERGKGGIDMYFSTFSFCFFFFFFLRAALSLTSSLPLLTGWVLFRRWVCCEEEGEDEDLLFRVGLSLIWFEGGRQGAG